MLSTTSFTAHRISQSQMLFFSKVPNTGSFSKPLGYAFPKTSIGLKPPQVAKLSILQSQKFNGRNKWSAMQKSTIKSKAESISKSKKHQKSIKSNLESIADWINFDWFQSIFPNQKIHRFPLILIHIGCSGIVLIAFHSQGRQPALS